MLDFMLLMHGDATSEPASDAWARYLANLQGMGRFQGGSSIGAGVCVNQSGKPVPTTGHLVGYIKVQAESLEQARELVAGNPVFEAGGTIEIRELPRD